MKSFWVLCGRLVDMPFGYTRSLLIPSGSIKIWWLSLLSNFLTLSSIEGQYLGPIPFISPEYIAERWVFSLMILCVFLLVLVIKHESCFLCFFGGLAKDIHGVGFSPGCSSIAPRFMLESLILAGVPVFSLPILRSSE